MKSAFLVFLLSSLACPATMLYLVSGDEIEGEIVGIGFNGGAYSTSSKVDEDNEAPPKIISNPPLTVLGDFIGIDLEISLGFRL